MELALALMSNLYGHFEFSLTYPEEILRVHVEAQQS